MCGWVEYGMAKMDDQYRQGLKYESSMNLFFLPFVVGSKSSRLFNILDAHTNSCGHTSSSLPPTQSTWTYFLLQCHPRNLWHISTKNIGVLFTLGTRCISCNFRLTRVRLSPLHWQLSKRPLIQYPVIVIHKEEDIPRLHWSLMRIKEISKVPDGRVSKVCIQMRESKRSSNRKLTWKPVYLGRLIHRLTLLIHPSESDSK